MLFEELGKLRRSTIMMAIIAAAVAIVMIICPPQYVESLVCVLGYGMIILALVWILEFLSGKKSLMNYITLTGALVVALLGISLLINENKVLVIGIIFGLALVIAGGISLTNAWVYARRAQRRGWWVLVLLSLLLIAAGVIILINPWWNAPLSYERDNILFDVIGYALLFASVVSIVRLFMVWPIRNE